MEDGDPALNRPLEEKCRRHNFKWLATGKRAGQIPAIDAAYAHVDTEFIFHCEDDWEFTSAGFVEKIPRGVARQSRHPAGLDPFARRYQSAPRTGYTSVCR